MNISIPPIVLYDYWRSSASYRVRIALNIKGIPYDTVAINMVSAEHLSADYQAINPQRAVPAVKIGDTIMTQSIPIMEYLNDISPPPNILGENAKDRFNIRQISAVIACDIHPVCNLNVVQKIVNLTGNKDEKIKWINHYITKGLQYVEALLENSAGMYCVGDTLSMADCCLIPQVYNAHRWQVNITDLRHINRIYVTCLSQYSFIKAKPIQPKEGITT